MRSHTPCRSALPIIAVAVLMLMTSLVSLAASTLDQSDTLNGNPAVDRLEVKNDDRWGLAQTFGAGTTGSLDRVSLYVASDGQMSSMSVEIRATGGDGKPTGAALANGSYDLSGIGPAQEWVDVSLSSSVFVVSGTSYAIVVRATAGNSFWLMDTTKSYTPGRDYTSGDGTDWAAPLDECDLNFKTYVTASSQGSGGSSSGSEEPKWRPWPTPTPNPDTGEGMANPTVGGCLFSRDNRVTFCLPGAAYDRDLRMWYQKYCRSEIAPPPGWSYVGCPFDLRTVLAVDERVNISQFKAPGTITVRYTDAEAQGLLEPTFRLAYYDGGKWVEYPSSVEPGTNIVTAKTTHLTLHAVLGSAVSPAPVAPMDSVISGTVFYDREANGSFDGDDFPVGAAGVRISSGDWSAFHTTTADGRYSFPCLREGSYSVDLLVGPEWTLTSPSVVKDIAVTGQGDSVRGDVDFGIRSLLR